eukprot:CAMPEP_0171835460 /NCGR_PEP_ID=MMETSP0992-20121227/11007_1 /TAXON_ID=483369 /ORGANISM="non described non described, Strain CCMP2098" /LENGTH=109 /DNA_ID=CAMNT_0012451309 /DNA_START=162 /DNA_END=491 /DNA_ORIENTATION=-
MATPGCSSDELLPGIRQVSHGNDGKVIMISAAVFSPVTSTKRVVVTSNDFSMDSNVGGNDRATAAERFSNRQTKTFVKRNINKRSSTTVGSTEVLVRQSVCMHNFRHAD